MFIAFLVGYVNRTPLAFPLPIPFRGGLTCQQADSAAGRINPPPLHIPILVTIPTSIPVTLAFEVALAFPLAFSPSLVLSLLLAFRFAAKPA